MRMVPDAELRVLLESIEGASGLIRPLPSGYRPRPWEDKADYPGDDAHSPWTNPVQMQGTHFYYIGMAGTMLRTLVYRHGDPSAPEPTLPDEPMLLGWIADAKASGNGSDFRNFDDVEWHWPTHLIFFIDLPGWNYLTDPEDGNRMKALHFAEVPQRGSQPKYNANYSFYSARLLQIQVGAVARDLLVAENHHFSAPAHGPGTHTPRRPPDASIDHYKYDIFMGVDIEFSVDQKMWFTIDPGGKNLGPP